MTRARLIEKAIAEWLERNDAWACYDADGTMTMEDDLGRPVATINVLRMAEDIDAELDRIIRETTK